MYRVIIANQAFENIDKVMQWRQENEYPLQAWKEELFRTIFSLDQFPTKRRTIGQSSAGIDIRKIMTQDDKDYILYTVDAVQKIVIVLHVVHTAMDASHWPIAIEFTDGD